MKKTKKKAVKKAAKKNNAKVTATKRPKQFTIKYNSMQLAYLLKCARIAKMNPYTYIKTASLA